MTKRSADRKWGRLGQFGRRGRATADGPSAPLTSVRAGGELRAQNELCNPLTLEIKTEETRRPLPSSGRRRGRPRPLLGPERPIFPRHGSKKTPKSLFLYFPGGWICHDDLSCSERRHRENRLTSSDRWPSVQAVGGILSADPAENPHFADANHVFVPYCSSDAWAGRARGRRGGGGGGGEAGLAFMGGHIVREVIRELADFQQLLAGRELYLAGSSAGGIGVMMNVDAVAAMVSRTNLRVRGIVDSGWFVDNDPFSAVECAGGACSVISALRRGVALWNARVPQDCHKRYPGEMWKCFLGYRLYPFLKSERLTCSAWVGPP